MSSTGKILPRSVYAEADVVEISRFLLGKLLCSRTDSGVITGYITETEAYCGRNDKACHASEGLRTERTEVMFGPPGHAYVYLCYGIHHLFNVVTNQAGLADAVLIRAVRPVQGLEQMQWRRNMAGTEKSLTDGPGKLSQALGITTADGGTDLLGDRIWIEDCGLEISPENIVSTPRIGISYAGDDADRPWRFHTKL